MTIARSLLAVSLGLLAAAALPAATGKPRGADPSDPREIYRGRGMSICVAELESIEEAGADAAEAACGCAFDRFMPRWPTGALPPLGSGRLPPAIGSELVACAAGQDAALGAALARRLAAAPTEAEAGGKPIDGYDASGAPERPAWDFRTWVDGLGLPRWLRGSSLPLWIWVPLIVFVFLFLRGLMRRRDRDDLIGPPRSIDPGTRRPDLPPPRR